MVEGSAFEVEGLVEGGDFDFRVESPSQGDEWHLIVGGFGGSNGNL